LKQRRASATSLALRGDVDWLLWFFIRRLKPRGLTAFSFFFNATVIGAGDDGGAVAETAQGVRNVVRASRRRFFLRQPFLSVGYCVVFLGVRLSRAIFFQKSLAADGFAVAGKKARRDFPLSRRR